MITFVPLAILLVGFGTVHHILREVIHTPRSFTLNVTGAKDQKFIGVVELDGERKILKGQLPATFEYQGLHLDFAFGLVDPKEGQQISVQVLIDGEPGWSHEGRSKATAAALKEDRTRDKDDDIAAGEYKSFGYNEWIGGTSRNSGGLFSTLPSTVAKLRENAQ